MLDKNVFATRITERVQDPRYRTALIADPKRVVESEFGITLPETVAIRVIERRANEHYIVLPPVEASEEPPLDESDATVW